MDISPLHAAAVVAACRLPALQARLDLLASDDSTRAVLAFYATAYPDPPGSAAGGDPLVTLSFSARAGVVDADLYRILIDTPLEAQVTGADPDDGSIPLWARISGPAGDWWADLTVSVEGDGGEIQLVQTGVEGGSPVVRWYNGAFARVASAAVQG